MPEAFGHSQETGFPMLSILPVLGLHEIEVGADLPSLLARHLCAQGTSPLDGDIVVVAQKIVSKAEGRFIVLADVVPSERARDLAGRVRKDPRLVEMVLRESSEVLRAIPEVLITRHRLGHVMANAGIDASNLGPGREGQILLLPEDPDQSARHIADAIERKAGHRPAVIISDSFGRAWRTGTVNVAIGVAGIAATRDQRGETDRDGRVLQVTCPATADAVAAAAGLVMGEASQGIPAALVRGLSFEAAMDTTAGALVRPLEQDLFR